MDLKVVNYNNIDREHICCAISEKRGENCAASKKEWMKKRFEEGLVFRKLDIRGKVFIEYIPAENAFAPIEAPNYMYINCFWVSGKYKGQGHANDLLETCIKESKELGKEGIVVLSSKKKKPFLSDPKYLKHKGFKVCDDAAPYFELLYLPFNKEGTKPKFRPCVSERIKTSKDFVLFFSNQCPHTEKYAGLVRAIALANGLSFETRKIESVEDAKNAPTPFTTYSLYVKGEFYTTEILSEKKFHKLITGML